MQKDSWFFPTEKSVHFSSIIISKPLLRVLTTNTVVVCLDFKDLSIISRNNSSSLVSVTHKSLNASYVWERVELFLEMNEPRFLFLTLLLETIATIGKDTMVVDPNYHLVYWGATTIAFVAELAGNDSLISMTKGEPSWLLSSVWN